MSEIVCPACGRAYHDPTQQIDVLRRLAAEGRLSLLLGCGGCGLLYAPRAEGFGSERAAQAAIEQAPTILPPPQAPPRPPYATHPAPAPPAAQEETAPSPSFLERYALERQLGSGGMGTTHAAYDRIEDRFVCVKLLHPSFDQQMVLQEWLAMVALAHPNIVRAYEVGADGGRFYLVSELVQGETLDEMSKTIGPMSEGFVVEIARQLFSALAYAHEKRIIHRDIKPHNLMLSWNDTNPVLKVVDFGLALVRERDARSNVTGEGALAGTPLYMAPEQLRGERLDASCDIYAVGVTLYHLLHGRLPYSNAANVFAALTEIASRREGLRPSPNSVSPKLAELITRCTSGNRAERPSALEALALLDAVSPPLTPPAVVMPMNPWLESPPETSGYPLGWGDGVGIVDEASERALVERVQSTLWRVRLRLLETSPGEFCTITQRCPARSLAGYTAILSGTLCLREAAPDTWAGFWGRVDSPDGEPLFFQNMHDQPVLPHGRPEARELRFVIPPGAEWLNFGALLVGHGELLIGAISLVLVRPDGVQLAPLLLLGAESPLELT